MRNRTLCALFAIAAISVPVTASAQDTIEDVSLKEGVNDENQILAPLFDSASVAPLFIGPFERGYDPAALVFQKGGKGSLFLSPGPEYFVDKRLDLAASLRTTLTEQSAAMGLKVATAPEGAWVLTGSLKDMHFITEQTAGATLFYATTQVTLSLRSPDGTTTPSELRLLTYKAIHRRGFGRQGRAREALAITLTEVAHEILGHLQLTVWRLPLHARAIELVAKLDSASLNELYRAGLTGSADVAARLLEILPRRDDADDRVIILEALGRLRFAKAVPVLDERYVAEDEDCRWASLKALGYIGGSDARAVIAKRGPADEYRGAKRLAEEILKAP